MDEPVDSLGDADRPVEAWEVPFPFGAVKNTSTKQRETTRERRRDWQSVSGSIPSSRHEAVMRRSELECKRKCGRKQKLYVAVSNMLHEPDRSRGDIGMPFPAGDD